MVCLILLAKNLSVKKFIKFPFNQSPTPATILLKAFKKRGKNFGSKYSIKTDRRKFAYYFRLVDVKALRQIRSRGFDQ